MIARYAILIVNWNSWQLLGCCLDALKKQTYRNFQVYIADNGSSQPMPNNLLSIHDAVFVKFKNNLGFAEANNRLLQLAGRSEWVVLLNPDAFPEPDWLEQLTIAANQNPEFAFFSSRLIMTGFPARIDGEGDSYHLSGLGWRKNHGKILSTENSEKAVFSACAAAAMYRMKAIREVGGFDPSFFCYFEDIDLGFRLRLAGNKCLYVPSAIVKHVGSATSGGNNSNFSIYHGHRNMVWTYIKNMPGPLFWIFLPIHIIINIVSLVWFTIRGQRKTIIRAKIDAIKGFPAVWRKRIITQDGRRTTIKAILRIIDKNPVPKNLINKF
jgi:GT2 family glycosyltransferase